MNTREHRRRPRWTRGACALAAVLSLLVAGAPPARAESSHWGAGRFHIDMSSAGIPLSTERPGKTSWWLASDEGDAVIWHRGTEVTVGDASVSGSLTGNSENTLGALGTASLNLYAAPSGTGSALHASVTGTYRRTQVLFQLELQGTAYDSNGEVVPVRITGSGPWRPTTGDGVLTPITGAEADIELVVIFPGDIPPPPGPKAGSAIEFAGTASLPNFPCPAPVPGQMLCTGTFSGEVEAAFAGDNASGIWALEMAAALNTSFSYVDLIQPGVGCIEGAANGTATITVDQDTAIGVWTNRVTVPQFVRGAVLSFRYSWLRVGVTAVLTLSEISLTLHVGPGGWVQVIAPDSSAAPAVAAFVPALTTQHIEACELGQTGPPLTAAVNGVASIGGF